MGAAVGKCAPETPGCGIPYIYYKATRRTSCSWINSRRPPGRSRFLPQAFASVTVFLDFAHRPGATLSATAAGGGGAGRASYLAEGAGLLTTLQHWWDASSGTPT